jgi:hypothetical protein
MSYSDLLARQEQELSQLNAQYFVDHTAIKKLQAGHHDSSFYAGELERLQAAHVRKVKETEARFATERKTYLNEPDITPDMAAHGDSEMLGNLSVSQDKAVAMLDEYRQRQQQQAGREKDSQPTPQPHQYPNQTPDKTSAPSASPPKDDDIKQMMEDTRRRREAWKYRRGGHKR